ncbi:L-lysine exporter family protein LysE/ArgO [Paenibacillus sp. UNC496MF]|uniref:LysE/ArgO family amino acid transporter n=1 Tax=Paenibacillus sp. UNC496MF TaxID=1502753 RepID=UPI0008EB9EAF|nr:LysE family transporter [Paenibacillus sp. UNC496MF]SFI37236.1 L-lysine exporter family protein LysE/ArgO [Paenibacillus sp. UNC496MF]
MVSAVIQGFVLALGLILPLGVQNMFVFNQGATQRRYVRALPAVLVASLCDTLLILLAVLGVSTAAFGIAWLKLTLMLAGIVFLLYMGRATWKSGAGTGAGGEPPAPLGPRRQAAFALSVSLLNPHALMDTIGVIGTSSLNYEGADKLAFAGICILVSWLWYFALALAGRIVGAKDRAGRLQAGLNRLSALVMWGTAAYLVYMLLA